MSGPICKLCHLPIDKPRQAWREQLGWVSPHGAKAMTGAAPTGELAHAECVALLRAKVPVGQEVLI